MLAAPAWSFSAISVRILPSRSVDWLLPGRRPIVDCHRSCWLTPSRGFFLRRIRVTPSSPRGLFLRLHGLLGVHGAMVRMLNGWAILICLTRLVPHVHRAAIFTWISPSSCSIIYFHSSANRFWRWLLPSCGHFFFRAHSRHRTTQPA